MKWRKSEIISKLAEKGGKVTIASHKETFYVINNFCFLPWFKV